MREELQSVRKKISALSDGAKTTLKTLQKLSLYKNPLFENIDVRGYERAQVLEFAGYHYNYGIRFVTELISGGLIRVKRFGGKKLLFLNLNTLIVLEALDRVESGSLGDIYGKEDKNLESESAIRERQVRPSDKVFKSGIRERDSEKGGQQQ